MRMMDGKEKKNLKDKLEFILDDLDRILKTLKRLPEAIKEKFEYMNMKSSRRFA